MCPSCEKNPIDQDGVCAACRAEYIRAFGPNWRETEAGRFLVESNQQTRRMIATLHFAPPTPNMDRLLATDMVVPTSATNTSVDAMIAALMQIHGWSYKRIHTFLLKGGQRPPSLSTVKRRVYAMRRQQIRGQPS